ncbi:Serine/threonine-protein phosphatase 6 regulatory ankyrin repeat subunit B-like [Oopsacas minuta]|uniref:Serine/threonine-protein phosphatase 6 regulatory ankyrin repeat subunit B-like n=1 Tax=Oopsacas minuta TaxID=111878 RepID=A0AAV7KFC7_9METZ|nr:Serine/threonine-protein phosphatase 6 regulatory ankyrin repeat subunit B-like [Oopsacas minuta]
MKDSSLHLKNSPYDLKRFTFEYLFKAGVRVLIHNETDTMLKPIMEEFKISRVKEDTSPDNNSLVISIDIYQTKLFDQYSLYALLAKPNELKVIETKKLVPSLPEDIRDNFADILSLDCPQILDYIFDPKNKLVSKTDKFPKQNGRSLIHVAAQICKSELLFKHLVKYFTNWRLLTDENTLHTCISNGNFRNLNVLIEIIPLNELNKLLFSKNQQNMTLLNAIVEFPGNEHSIQLLLDKGCLDENGNNLAHCAIIYRNMNFLRLVLRLSSQKWTFTDKNKNGFNPLHLAVKQSFEEAVTLLVDTSDLTILSSRDVTGCNCLHTSIIHFNSVTFKTILGAVIKSDKVSAKNDRIINSKITKLNLQTPVLLSIEKQKLKATKILLSHGARINISDGNNQFYPYYIQKYCSDQLKEILRLKVDQRNNPLLNNQCTIEDLLFNDSPLIFYFLQYTSFKIFQKFCEAFSLINIIKVDKVGSTILHLASNNDELTEYILKLCSYFITQERKTDITNFINSKNMDCNAPLHLATLNGNKDIVESLLKYSPNITCEDKEGNTPLHLAAKLNYISIVKILIEYARSIQGDYPSFINSVNKEKMTSLHLAIIHSNLVIAAELLHGKAELYAHDHYGRTVLHHAVLIPNEDQSINTIKFLINHEERNPDPERKLILIQDTSNNNTPLHLAIQSSKVNATKELFACSPDLKQCDSDKTSVLHKAISRNIPVIIDNVLEYIKNTYPKGMIDPLHVLNLADIDGNTALDLAIIDSREDSITKLLVLNPLLNLKNNCGHTPLHIAVSKKENILKLILDKINENPQEKHSYLYAVDKEGLPPLHYAIVHDHLKSVEILIDFGAQLANIPCVNESLTLYNGKSNLSLCFCKAPKGFIMKLVSEI